MDAMVLTAMLVVSEAGAETVRVGESGICDSKSFAEVGWGRTIEIDCALRITEDPLAAVESFYLAYADMDIDALIQRTHIDFRFASDDREFCASHPDGFSIADELHVLEGIRAAAAHATGEHPVISITHAGMQFLEPTGGETLEVVVYRPVLRIRAGDQEETASSFRHRFLLLRSEDPGDGMLRIVRWTEELGEPDTTGRDSVLVEKRPAPAPLAPATDEDLPKSLALARAAAEPGPVLAFGVALPRAADVVVSLIDVQGRVNERVHAPTLAAGRHVVRLSGANASPGIYWARLQAGAERRELRVTLVR